MAKDRRVNNFVRFRLLNIQGLTKVKTVEMGNLLAQEKYMNILCLTETQQKYKKVTFSEGVKCRDKMRKIEDKKGGGLSILAYQGDGVVMEENECDNADIMKMKIEIAGRRVVLLLVYVDHKLQERNEKILNTLDNEISKVDDHEHLMMLGDFNGHLEFIGQQKLNVNGKMILNLLEKWNLILLHGDLRCEGIHTQHQNGQKNAIDFIIVNQVLYSYFVGMKIDEDKLECDLSDHCLCDAWFDFKEGRSEIMPCKVVDDYYYKTN